MIPEAFSDVSPDFRSDVEALIPMLKEPVSFTSTPGDEDVGEALATLANSTVRPFVDALEAALKE